MWIPALVWKWKEQKKLAVDMVHELSQAGDSPWFTHRQVAPVNGMRRFAQFLGRGRGVGVFDDPSPGSWRLPLKPLQCHWALGVNIARPVPGGHGDWRNALGQWATWAVLRWLKKSSPLGLTWQPNQGIKRPFVTPKSGWLVSNSHNFCKELDVQFHNWTC